MVIQVVYDAPILVSNTCTCISSDLCWGCVSYLVYHPCGHHATNGWVRSQKSVIGLGLLSQNHLSVWTTIKRWTVLKFVNIIYKNLLGCKRWALLIRNTLMVSV